MIKNDRKRDRDRLLCGKIINESWSQVGKYIDEIKLALKKNKLNKRDLLLLKISARAFVQKSMMEKIDSIALFGVDLDDSSPCGLNPNCDECDRDVCLLVV